MKSQKKSGVTFEVVSNNTCGANFSQHTACIGQPAKDRPGLPSDAPTRTWQGCRVKVHARRGDRQRMFRVELPHRGTWSGIAQKRHLDGEGDYPYHPAAAMAARPMPANSVFQWAQV